MNRWDAQQYQGKHSYVWQLGGPLVEMLAPRPGERILDLGCGTGQLTAEIARSGAQVVGLDNSPAMLDQARRNYPGLNFVSADAAGFHFERPFDAVFSNAALHWVKDGEGAVQSIARALRPGGRFVAEFGGKGNIASILAALDAVFGQEAQQKCPWWYPGIGEYASLLERHGLEVRNASLFDRPTPLQGEQGMEGWIEMFCGSYLRDLPAGEARRKVRELADRLRAKCYRDGVWTVDYRRLRVSAIRLSDGQPGA